ncbi:hypothetical protein [Salisaeta longa]|uniref:hypothetical protein n=1 Tax=Salisaeta longa TaxID=503170 RepID=UPI0003B6EB1F|nr:hypothetical protein [Salisaeta longa]
MRACFLFIQPPGATPHVTDAPDASFIDTPYGLFTASGRWFHVTADGLKEYAPAVLDAVPLARLVAWAEAWHRTPEALLLWALPVLLWVLPALPATTSAVGLYLGWKIFSPSVASLRAAKIMRWAEHPVSQGTFYVVSMSAFAAQSRFWAVGVGLTVFVLGRWGVLERIGNAAVRPIWRLLYTLPAADQMLRAIIVRVAVSRRLPLPEVDDMARAMIDNWSVRRDD